MKIAVTFFAKKKKEKIYNKININSNKNEIKNLHIIFVMLLVTICIYNSTNLLYLANNLTSISTYKISKEDIIGLKGMANFKNYKYSKLEEKEDIIEESLPEEYIAMDILAEEYLEQSVFGSTQDIKVNIIAENESYQKLNVGGIDIINYSTNRNIDFEKILNEDNIELVKSKDEVLIYATHTSESYANSEEYSFEYISPRRSNDGRYNMLAISSELAQNLNNKGINTVLSLTPHDYGEYNSAYSNSRKTINALLNENNKINLLIDVHRDAIADLDFAPKVNLKGYDIASLMFVMGIGYDGEENPYYIRNLKLAIQLQMIANKVYPGLFRTMIIRNSVYNQDMHQNSFLVEVGASGNTIEEAKVATRCLANLLNLVFKD